MQLFCYFIRTCRPSPPDCHLHPPTQDRHGRQVPVCRGPRFRYTLHLHKVNRHWLTLKYQGLIGDSAPDSNVDTTQLADDPSDFLARERALLGDDADQFATPADNNATSNDNDLLGGAQSNQAPADQDMGGFESSFPAIDTSNEVGPPDT